MSGAASDDELESCIPPELLASRTRSWLAARRSKKTLSFQQDVSSMSERYEGSGPSKFGCSGSPHHEARQQHGCAGNRDSFAQLPDDLLVLILRRTLDPDHPGSLCSNTYISDLRATPVLKSPRTFAKQRLLSSHFSRTALLEQRPHGPLPSILVCKRWQRIISRCDVVSVMAVAFPARLPSSLRTLLLRMESVELIGGDSAEHPSRVAKYASGAVSCMQGLQQLEELVCCNIVRAPFGEKSVRQLGQTFANLAAHLPSSLLKLDISDSWLSNEALDSLIACLPRLTSLVSLTLWFVHLRGDAFEKLAPCIGRLTQITRLDLGGNTMPAVQPLIEHLKALPLLRALALPFSAPCVLARQDSLALARYLSGVRDMTVLDARDVGFDLEKAELGTALLQPVLSSTSLICLELDLQSAGHVGVSICFKALRSLPALRHLRLLSHRNEDDGPLEIEDDQTPMPLEKLALAGDAVHALRDMPESRRALMTALTSLELGHCKVSDAGLDTRSHVQHLSGLQELELYAMRFQTRDQLDALAPHVSCLVGLRELSLNDNHLWDEVCDALARVLSPLTGLEVLDLDCNHLTEVGVSCLTPALANMQHLKVLDLHQTPLGLACSRDVYVVASPLAHADGDWDA